MLSSLPKLADRNFILGFFLPALLFACGCLWLFSDYPTIGRLLTDLSAKDPGKAAFILVGIWLLGVLMLTLNHPLYRFLEGYMWPISEWQRCKEKYRRRLRDGQDELRTLYNRWAQEGDAFPRADLERYERLSWKLPAALPSRESDVLPTAFGNAIKAFEVYPRDVYGADSVPIWLRLLTVLPKDFLEQVQDVRSQIDFLINTCFFAAILGLIALIDAMGSWAPWLLFSGKTTLPTTALIWDQFPGTTLACSFFLFGISWGCYRWSVTRIPAWGALVMTAFDCYLPALAKQLGIELPKTTEQRDAFWKAFSQMVVYRRSPDGRLPFRFEDWNRASADEHESAWKEKLQQLKERFARR